MEVILAIRKIKATPKREGREIFPSTWEDQRNTFGDGIGPGSHGTIRIQKHRDGVGGGGGRKAEVMGTVPAAPTEEREAGVADAKAVCRQVW